MRVCKHAGQSALINGNERNTDHSAMRMHEEEDEEMLLVGFSAGALYKRADFLDKEEAAKSHPNRNYYFRKHGQEDLSKLVELSSRQLRVRPDNTKALHIRAMSLMKLGAFESAVADYSAILAAPSKGDAIDGAPTDAVTLYNRGCAYKEMGEFALAVADLSAVLEQDPSFAAAAYLRGACQNQMGNFDAAILDYTMALSKDQVRVYTMASELSIVENSRR